MSDERDDHRDKTAGRIMLGSILFSAIAGVGIGTFFVQPFLGGLIGAAVGIPLGFWLIPGLLKEIEDRP